MTHGGTAHSPDRPASASTLERSLEEPLRRLHPRRMLLLCAQNEARFAWPGPSGTHVVELVGSGPVLDGAARCALDELPFEENTFELVVVRDMIADGSEALVDEACRVLVAGGQLWITGPGRFGGQWRDRPGVRALRATRLCRALEARAFRVAQCDGIGVRGRPAVLSSAWQRPLMSWCEQIIVRARHRDHDARVTPMRFSRPGATAATGAVLDGVSRRTMP
ncbi:MAG: hypothetical protein HKN58_09025 [Xanthomonadales bacterium]|nr:hypothetical protein [Xanthomonadales bacterium]